VNVIEGVRLAFAQIRAQKLKSFFAVIGVVIGVMFLITVVSVVEGMNRYMEEDFAKRIYGLNTLVVRRTPEIQTSGDPDLWRAYARRPRLTNDDAAAIRNALSVPALMAVESSTGGRVVSESGIEIDNVWLTAASADIFRIRDMGIERGRAFSSPEDRAGVPVVVLGADAAEKLFGALDPLDRVVRIRGEPYRVIGVLAKQGTLFGMSLDNRAIAPAGASLGRQIVPFNVVQNILVRPVSATELDRARIDVEATMRERHRLRPTQDNSFSIETASDSLSFWENIRRMLMIAFPGLVSIALVVGGIVIMNIMLVSVAERTREIGLRKALGARRRDIHLQMLIESATLSGVGAVLGIGVGVGLAHVVRAVSPLPAAMSPLWIGVAAALGVGVGIVAGIYPATKAAKLDPIVALRQE
jgi:putative ABC transport system permease protein